MTYCGTYNGTACRAWKRVALEGGGSTWQANLPGQERGQKHCGCYLYCWRCQTEFTMDANGCIVARRMVPLAALEYLAKVLSAVDDDGDLCPLDVLETKPEWCDMTYKDETGCAGSPLRCWERVALAAAEEGQP